MNYDLFLSGGGSVKETYILDDLFLKTAGERILYLPIGLKRTFTGYDGCVMWFTDMVSLHGLIKKIYVWIHLKDKAEKISKNNFDAVYIGGASDTLRLHNLFIKYNIYPQLLSFVEQGGKIYGGSGGATILGKSINYDQIEKGLPKVFEESANLCLGYSIFTHLNKKNIFFLKRSLDNIIGIPEKGGVMIDIKERLLTYTGRNNGLIISKFKTQILQDGATRGNL